MGYLYLEEIGLKDLSDKVKAMVERGGEKIAAPSETMVEDIVNEVVHAINDFSDWYLSPEDDVRKTWIPSKIEGVNPEIAESVREVVEDNLEGLRSIDELPVEPDVTDTVTKLTAMAENWTNWYPGYKKQRDERAWLEQRAIHQEIYDESDYGNYVGTKESADMPGNSNAFDDGFNPYTVKAAEPLGANYGEEVIASGFIKIKE